MRDRLSAADLTRAWDAGAERGPVDRALVLLWAAGAAAEGLPSLPLASLDRALLALRAAIFGDRMACVATCPRCSETLEFDVSAAALADALPEPAAATVTAGGREIVLRPLDSRDLADAAACADVAEAAALLRARSAPDAEGLHPVAAGALHRLIDARQADEEIRISLTCPACDFAWSEPLDVAGFVWAEVETAALRLMSETAEIARAFHWGEADILGMSPARRRAYLALARTS